MTSSWTTSLSHSFRYSVSHCTRKNVRAEISVKVPWTDKKKKAEVERMEILSNYKICLFIFFNVFLFFLFCFTFVCVIRLIRLAFPPNMEAFRIDNRLKALTMKVHLELFQIKATWFWTFVAWSCLRTSTQSWGRRLLQDFEFVDATIKGRERKSHQQSNIYHKYAEEVQIKNHQRITHLSTSSSLIPSFLKLNAIAPNTNNEGLRRLSLRRRFEVNARKNCCPNALR